jgi:redox-sensitive bicupin YhaK (pirin superfamily)
VALPSRHEETAPAFAHHAGAELPLLEGEGKSVRVIAGSLYGRTAPVQTFSDLFYADAVLAPGTKLPLDAQHEERAAYLLGGTVRIAGQAFEPGRMLIFRPGDSLTVEAMSRARLLLIGGEPMDGPRHIWWNFVSSRKERIEAAKRAWQQGGFAPVPGETEFIPLPAHL